MLMHFTTVDLHLLHQSRSTNYLSSCNDTMTFKLIPGVVATYVSGNGASMIVLVHK